MSQVILFDLDGTLTDSGEGIMKSVQYALDKMGAPEENLENLRCFVGPPLKEQFMEYRGWDEAQAETAVRYYRERFVETGIYENRLYPKIPELLEILRVNDKILGVATSKPEVFAEQILKHFQIRQYFQVVVGSELDGTRTRKAEVIEEALRRLQITEKRDRVLMVGDKSHDVLGATTCGIQCIGVTYGYGTAEELQEAGAVYLADSVEDLGILASPNDEETTEHVESVRRNPSGHLAFGSRRKEKRIKKKEEKTKELSRGSAVESKQEEAAEPEMQRRPAGKRGAGFWLFQCWRVIYPILIHYGTSIIVVLCFTGFYLWQMYEGNSTYEDANEKMQKAALMETLITSILAGGILGLLYRMDQKKRHNGSTGMGKEFVWAPPVIWCCVVVLSIASSQFLNDLISLSRLNDLFPSYGKLQEQTMLEQPVWLLFLTVGILGPVAEEFLFRGLIFHRMKDWIRPGWAILFSSILFGLYHGNMVQFLYATLMGLILAFLYYRTGTLWISILAHVVANMWSLFGSGWWDWMTAQLPFGNVIGLGLELLLCVIPAYWLLAYKGGKSSVQS